MELALRAVLCVGVMLLLTTPIASQCVLPTEQDVVSVADSILSESAPEGPDPPTVQTVFQMQFTCLARVALDMYSSATVVANFTTTASLNISTVEQYQLVCSSGVWLNSSTSGFKATLPAMPFALETSDQCSQCEELLSPPPNYDPDSNCIPCALECNSTGGGFCTGSTAADCCPFFNSSNGACVDNCTDIDPNFGPDDNFVCVCNISCSPGFTPNTSDCSCELTDGCEAAGQPCVNGGSCMSDLSAPAGGPYYSCECANAFSGDNCTIVLATVVPSSTNLPSTACSALIDTTTAILTSTVTESITATLIITSQCSVSPSSVMDIVQSGCQQDAAIALGVLLAIFIVATIVLAAVLIIYCMLNKKGIYKHYELKPDEYSFDKL